MPDQYSVGEGIRAAMQRNGDKPRGHESYIQGLPYSMAPGDKGIYIYSAESGHVSLCPKV